MGMTLDDWVHMLIRREIKRLLKSPVGRPGFAAGVERTREVESLLGCWVGRDTPALAAHLLRWVETHDPKLRSPDSLADQRPAQRASGFVDPDYVTKNLELISALRRARGFKS